MAVGTSAGAPSLILTAQRRVLLGGETVVARALESHEAFITALDVSGALGAGLTRAATLCSSFTFQSI